MTQLFKLNDELEQKVFDTFSFSTMLTGLEMTIFYQNANEAYPLGDALYILNRDPMAGVLLPETFRESFPEIHSQFTRPGVFEFYLNVLRKIWGETANIEFVIPAPGKLNINIEALTLELLTFTARKIENNTYIFEDIETQAGETLVFQGTQGIKDQREANALVREIAPQGIFTQINLEIV